MMRPYSRVKQEPAALVIGKSGTASLVVIGRDLRVLALHGLLTWHRRVDPLLDRPSPSLADLHPLPADPA